MACAKWVTASALLVIGLSMGLQGFAQAQAKFPWQFDKEYVINYKQGETLIGTEKVRFRQTKREGKDALEARSVVAITVGAISAAMNVSFVVTPEGRPIEYVNDAEQTGQKVKIVSKFKEGKVTTTITGAFNATKEDTLPAGTFLFENNTIGGAMLVAHHFKLEPGKPFSLVGYYPSMLNSVKLTIDAKALKPVTIGGKSVDCLECQIPEVSGITWVTKDGRVVKFQQGPIIIELVSLE